MARKWKSIKSQRARRLQVTGSLLGLSYHSFTHSLCPEANVVISFLRIFPKLHLTLPLRLPLLS